MEDVVWLSRFTTSGLESILQMDVELFREAFEAASKIFEEEIKMPRYVIVKGFEKQE